MNDKIDELKQLIETLAEDSPLRTQLEAALQDELKRKAEAEAAKAAESKAEESQAEESDEEESDETGDGPFGDILHKIEALMEDEEFITASAGFVLGAATVGLGVLGASILKK